MKSKIINITLIILVIVALSALAFLIRVGVKGDTVAVLDISGMTCGSCVAKVNNAIQTKQGIASVDVDIDSGRAVVGYAADKIKPAAITAAVTGLGFTCRLVEVSNLAEFKSRHPDTAFGQQGAAGCDCSNK